MPSLLCLVSALRKLPSLRRVDFRGLSEPDYFDTIGSSPAARIQPLRSLCLGGHSRSCFSSLESVDVLDLRPRLYKESDDLMAMNSFVDGLTTFSRRYSWTRGDPYVLLLRAVWDVDNLRACIKGRSTRNRTVIPRNNLLKIFDPSLGPLGHFRSSIVANVADYVTADVTQETRILQCLSAARELYKGVLPLFPHIQAVVLVLDIEQYTVRCTWDAIVSLSNNIRSLQVVVAPLWLSNRYVSDPFSILEFSRQLYRDVTTEDSGSENGQLLSLHFMFCRLPCPAATKLAPIFLLRTCGPCWRRGRRRAIP